MHELAHFRVWETKFSGMLRSSEVESDDTLVTKCPIGPQYNVLDDFRMYCSSLALAILYVGGS